MNKRSQSVIRRSLTPVGTRGATAAADDRHRASDCLKLVRERLVNLIEQESLPDNRKGCEGLAVEERAYAAQVLGQLGDPRPGVGVMNGVPDIDWIEIPPGKFLMGGDGEFHGGRQFKCGLIKSAYQISRYPITGARYQAFVDDKGYQQSQFWTDAGWEWRTREKITSPRDYVPVFQTPNHPRAGVSWYEAVAYCRWMSDKLGRDIRLPSEAEWERAAGGKHGVRYPWGDARNSAERCNWHKTKLEHSSSVGVFPLGNAECGAADLAGNVWEWCRTAWLEDYEDYEKKVSDDLEGHTARVLRGGSWSIHFFRSLMPSYRGLHGYDPDCRLDRVGFRCVWVATSARKWRWFSFAL